MGLFKSLFKKEIKHAQTDAIQQITDTAKGPPCPLEVAMYNACVCARCKHLDICPMEAKCRTNLCKAIIGSCTIYDCEDDKDVENKRKVFKDGLIFEPSVFRFSDSKQTKEDI